MAVQLTHVYHQILSVLTHKQLERIMNQRGNYDLRRLLGGNINYSRFCILFCIYQIYNYPHKFHNFFPIIGTEKFIDSLLDLMDHEPSVLLGAVCNCNI